MKATWQDTVLAESDRTIVVEGNHYFPPVQVGEQTNQDAAWYYPEPKEAANSIKSYVAFWRGVKVSE